MAWNTPGSNKPDPWRGKRKGSDGDPMQRLRDMFGGGGSSGFNPLMVVAAIFLVWLLFNSFKLIDERERGVVLRFGDFNRIMQPGPNFKWPWPIETAIVVDATNVFTLSGEVRVLTQDENIVDIKYNVQYRKTDPRVFLFGSADPETTLKQAAESAVREAVGNNTMDIVLFERSSLVATSRERLQKALEKYETGLAISEFNLPDARPPEEVKKAFDDAISAREDKNRIENEAKALASKIVPEARGQAAAIRQEAQGYKDALIAKASGDAQRFTLLANEYRRAPEVTRKRLYLETMQEVIAANQRILLGSDKNTLFVPMPASATGGQSINMLPPQVIQGAQQQSQQSGDRSTSKRNTTSRSGGR